MPTAGAVIPPETTGSKALEDVISSFLSDEGDDNEIITIDFDQLQKRPPEEMTAPEEGLPSQVSDMEQPEVGVEPLETPETPESEMALTEELEFIEEELEEMHDAGGRYEMGEDALYEDELPEELELQEEEGISTPAVQSAQKNLATAQTAKAAADGKVAKAQADLTAAQAEAEEQKIAAQKAASAVTGQAGLEEDFSITEEELSELAEEFKVDLKPTKQLRGFMGTTETEKKLARDVELAAARDSKEEKRRAEEEKMLSDLKEKLEESHKHNEDLTSLIEELKDNLVSLKEHTEKLSVSNAKLLYTNKVLADVSLNERQKKQIVENIAAASSVLEAKTIFGTLQSAVQGVSEKKPRESLSEALVRGSSPFLKRQQISSPEDNLSERMKILAGIKTK